MEFLLVNCNSSLIYLRNQSTCTQHSVSHANHSMKKKELSKAITSEYKTKEFYRSNVGPGSYDPISKASKTRIEYSFTKDSRLKHIQPSLTSAVGFYFPSHAITSKTSPRWVIGTAPKSDNYWVSKLNQRSPGPIYKCNANTAQSTSNCAVIFLNEE